MPGYEGYYQVSDLGRVKSLSRVVKKKYGTQTIRTRILKPCLNDHGYFNVGLCKDKKTKVIRVHKLVAMAFLGHVPCGYKEVINHINFDPKDNRPENLERVTPRENSNRKHLPSSSKYVGVAWEKGRKKWRADIMVGGKSIHLGRFKVEHDAHLAYEKALENILTGNPPEMN